MDKSKESVSRKKRIVVYVVAAFAVFFAFRWCLPLVFPFVLAYLLAEFVSPAARFLKRRLHIPIGIGGTVLLLLTLAGATVFVVAFVKLLLTQVSGALLHLEEIREQICCSADRFCCSADRWLCLEDGTTGRYLQERIMGAEQQLNTSLLPMISATSFAAIRLALTFLAELLVTLVAAVLILLEKNPRKEGTPVSGLLQKLVYVREQLYAAGAAFFKTQMLLAAIIAAICSLGLFFVKREYALLLGCLIALLDALPMIGSGLVFLPWILFSIVKGEMLSAVWLSVTYAACIVVREFLEPKLFGDRVGILPLYSLMSLYIGVRLFGISGVVLGPFGLVMIRAITESYENTKET